MGMGIIANLRSDDKNGNCLCDSENNFMFYLKVLDWLVQKKGNNLN